MWEGHPRIGQKQLVGIGSISFSYVGSRDWTKIVRLVAESSYLLGRLDNPKVTCWGFIKTLIMHEKE